MKITLNDNMQLTTESGTILDHQFTKDTHEIEIPSHNFTDLSEDSDFDASRAYGAALDTLEFQNSDSFINQAYAMIEDADLNQVPQEIEDAYRKRWDNQIEQIAESLVDISKKNVASLVFHGGADDVQYDIEVSDMAAEYIASNPLAQSVATTNILTGVHYGNTADDDAVAMVKDTEVEIRVMIENLFDEIAQFIPTPEFEDEFDDFYDGEDWDDEDWDDDDPSFDDPEEEDFDDEPQDSLTFGDVASMITDAYAEGDDGQGFQLTIEINEPFERTTSGDVSRDKVVKQLRDRGVVFFRN